MANWPPKPGNKVERRRELQNLPRSSRLHVTLPEKDTELSPPLFNLVPGSLRVPADQKPRGLWVRDCI